MTCFKKLKTKAVVQCQMKESAYVVGVQWLPATLLMTVKNISAAMIVCRGGIHQKNMRNFVRKIWHIGQNGEMRHEKEGGVMAVKDRNKTIEKIILTLIELETGFEKMAKPRLQYKNIRWSLACACDELQYRIQKKPKSDGNLYACPSCNVLLLNRRKHCGECGQALDWKVE